MRWALYNLLFTVGYLVAFPRFLLRMWRRGGYRLGFLQRLGVYSREVRRRLAGPRRIWVHAVSVGEIHVALQFIRELRARDPARRFILSTTTSTGHAVAGRGLDAGDVLLYVPADFPFVVRRALNRLRPLALILTESELWPNLIRQARARRIPVILVNGRISDSSFRGYRALKSFFGPVVAAMDLLLVQSPRDAERLTALGADPSRLHTLGTAKYDVAGDAVCGTGPVQGVLDACGIGPSSLVILGASTWPGEETALLRIHARLRPSFPGLKLVLVPRHAERRGKVEAAVRGAGVPYAMRSRIGAGRGAPPAGGVEVLVVDSTGELKHFCACAAAIFVGKSLTHHGGQNMIEPALFAKPVIVGPHTENFAVVVSDLLADGALIAVRDEPGLEEALRSLLSNPARRRECGERALAAVTARRGVVARSVDRIEAVLGGAAHGA